MLKQSSCALKTKKIKCIPNAWRSGCKSNSVSRIHSMSNVVVVIFEFSLLFDIFHQHKKNEKKNEMHTVRMVYIYTHLWWLFPHRFFQFTHTHTHSEIDFCCDEKKKQQQYKWHDWYISIASAIIWNSVIQKIDVK